VHRGCSHHVGSVCAAIISHRSNPVAAVALAGGVATLGALAAIDFRTHRMPNRIVGPLAAAAVAADFVAGLGIDRR